MPVESMHIAGIGGEVWLRILFAAAVLVFAWRMAELVRILKLGRAENRWNLPVRRAGIFLREVIGQKRLFEEPVIGWAHPLIFWGFCLFAIASALMLLGGMFPAAGIPQAEAIPVLAPLIDIFALIVLIALAAASIRRFFFAPKGLERTRDAAMILVLIAALMVTYLLAESLARAGEGPWKPVGFWTNRMMASAGLSESQILAVANASWWIHVLVLLGFLAYLPYSKHMHLLWGPFAVFFAETPRKGALPPAVEPNPGGDGNSNPLGRFTWRMLLSAYSCAECGRCERVCPASESGSVLSPKTLVHAFKEDVLRKGKAALRGAANGNGAAAGAGIPPQAVWGCATCYACMERCPVRNEHVPLIVELRRALVEDGGVDEHLQEALVSLQRYGNSFGQAPRKRLEWAKGLPFKIKDIRKEPARYLWFVGDYASYHPSAMRAARKTAMAFHRLGLDFGVLGPAERNSGNDARRAGEEGLFEMLAAQNIEAMEKAEFERIVTTDPHTYHSLVNEYPELGFEWPTEHHAQLLARLLDNGGGEGIRPLGVRAAYHDPCYLGRVNGVFDEPRRVLERLGVEIAEPPRTRDRSFCCGAGGGRVWMEEEEGIEARPAELRVREILELEGVSVLATACPKDIAMFEDAVKTAGAGDRLRIADIGELACEAMGLETGMEAAT